MGLLDSAPHVGFAGEHRRRLITYFLCFGAILKGLSIQEQDTEDVARLVATPVDGLLTVRWKSAPKKRSSRSCGAPPLPVSVSFSSCLRCSGAHWTLLRLSLGAAILFLAAKQMNLYAVWEVRFGHMQHVLSKVGVRMCNSA